MLFKGGHFVKSTTKFDQLEIIMLTKTLLDELFDYNRETGILTNKVNRGRRAMAGQEAGNTHKKKGGNGTVKHYKRVGIDGKLYATHRIIWFMVTGEWPIQVDHIDGDGLNNAWENLRNVTNLENSRNQRKSKRNTSGVTGVSWRDRDDRWVSMIGNRYLGSFVNFDDAVTRRREAEIEHNYHPNHGSDRV